MLQILNNLALFLLNNNNNMTATSDLWSLQSVNASFILEEFLRISFNRFGIYRAG